MKQSPRALESRVVAAAEAALAERNVVTAIDVFQRIGWLTRVHLDAWRQGRLANLEEGIAVKQHKISAAMSMLLQWARQRELTPSETAYVARTRDRQPLRFSNSGDVATERAYRTHWVSPKLSTSRRARLQERQSRPPDLVVIWPRNEWICTRCGGTGDFLLMEGPGPLCRTCAGLDHLVFLAAGNASVSRRARQASTQSVIVVRFSRSRKRYERQGILVEKAALDAAQQAGLG